MVQTRLTCISKTEEIFNESVHKYEKALSLSGYKSTLKFDKNKKIMQNNEPSNANTSKDQNNADNGTEKKSKTRNRKRNVTWYNPPFNIATEQNIGQMFLKIITKHFGRSRKDNLHKILNRKTLKIGCSCTQNFENIIQSHNKRILRGKRTETDNGKNCNCKTKNECPLNNNCVVSSVVYLAEVEHERNDEEKEEKTKVYYIGSTEGSFKERLYNHRTDMKFKKNRFTTCLAKHIWELKDQNKSYKTSWKIIEKCKQYTSGQKFCNVCNADKTKNTNGKTK